MKKNTKYRYPTTKRETIEGQRHYNINNGQWKLPSVTTILDKTQSAEKREGLKYWRERVGEKEASEIVERAAARGTAMHKFLEYYVRNQKLLDLSDEGRAARSMGQAIIDQGLKDVEEIWGSEVTVFYPGLYAGQTDLCGIFTGRESIIDFKQTNKPKKIEWIEDYFLQLAAYAMAHDQIYGTCIDQGVILMCSKDGFFQKFTSNGADFTRFKHKFLGRIDQFYQKKS